MSGELAMTTAPDDKRRIVDDITIELVRHSIAEATYLYPAVSKWVSDGSEIADRKIEDHSRAERILKELEDADAARPEFDALVRRRSDRAPDSGTPRRSLGRCPDQRYAILLNGRAATAATRSERRLLRWLATAGAAVCFATANARIRPWSGVGSRRPRRRRCQPRHSAGP